MGHHQDELEGRAADLDGLKALAHPLRVQIIEALSTYGEQTASGLAERLGESSGATSYHLRQLEKHGYVREVADRGTGRERWWERVPGPIHLGSPELDATEAGRAASRVIMREWLHHREAGLRDVIERGHEALSPEWRDALALQSASMHVTAAQLDELNHQIVDLIIGFAREHRGQRVPGSRPVHVQYYAYPVLDGVEIPLDASAGDAATGTATTSTATTAPVSTPKEG
ncbi:ArsR/SmtB family transcription factor [Microcella frigidaquae]|uniref:DNA-binding transcriptional ArsR family regulator n=1 Tax=Microcella frigidaquae TaxID=424758 RepID=A0A840XKC0_9MICO|nr:winged helix-turn-helix domain-containing protein [Microcella frigidaquae]MBB5617108.1 DNA-binding transcriptional ArsR family regulator [Microcella frigidaquae]NHN45311.1 helix-turn-helix domain-containing protein [Microcella frigidaquae]